MLLIEYQTEVNGPKIVRILLGVQTLTTESSSSVGNKRISDRTTIVGLNKLNEPKVLTMSGIYNTYDAQELRNQYIGHENTVIDLQQLEDIFKNKNICKLMIQVENYGDPIYKNMLLESFTINKDNSLFPRYDLVWKQTNIYQTTIGFPTTARPIDSFKNGLEYKEPPTKDPPKDPYDDKQDEEYNELMDSLYGTGPGLEAGKEYSKEFLGVGRKKIKYPATNYTRGYQVN